MVSLFAGVNGYMDKVKVDRILEFEGQWLEYVNSGHKHLWTSIKDKGQLTDENDAKMKSAMEEFMTQNEFA